MPVSPVERPAFRHLGDGRGKGVQSGTAGGVHAGAVLCQDWGKWEHGFSVPGSAGTARA